MTGTVVPAAEALPPGVRALFWEELAEEPSIERHRDYVAIRVLERGEEADVRWLLDRLGAERVMAIVGCGRVRSSHARFWRAVLEDA